MTPDELRRLERRAAGGDPRAKRVLRERERAIEAAERERRRVLGTYPSIKDLRTLFRPEDARKANVLRRVLDGRLDPMDAPRAFPATRWWLGGFSRLPSPGAITLRAAKEIIGGRVRHLPCSGSHGADENVHAVYVDAGDVYAPVLIRDFHDRQWLVMPWNDYVEREERKGGRCLPFGRLFGEDGRTT